MDEIIRNLNLLSYNKRDLIQDTWSGKKYNSDEEFMKMLLNDPETQKIIANNKLTNNYDNELSLENSDSELSSEDSDSERIDILSKYIKPNKNIKV